MKTFHSISIATYRIDHRIDFITASKHNTTSNIIPSISSSIASSIAYRQLTTATASDWSSSMGDMTAR